MLEELVIKFIYWPNNFAQIKRQHVCKTNLNAHIIIVDLLESPCRSLVATNGIVYNIDLLNSSFKTSMQRRPPILKQENSLDGVGTKRLTSTSFSFVFFSWKRPSTLCTFGKGFLFIKVVKHEHTMWSPWIKGLSWCSKHTHLPCHKKVRFQVVKMHWSSHDMCLEGGLLSLSK